MLLKQSDVLCSKHVLLLLSLMLTIREVAGTNCFPVVMSVNKQRPSNQTNAQSAQHRSNPPVRNTFGGYNRSPFEVSTDVFHNHSAVAGPPGSRTNSEGGAHNAERPWVRAGVGASKLSAKERSDQQQEAKAIYGDAAPSSVDKRNTLGAPHRVDDPRKNAPELQEQKEQEEALPSTLEGTTESSASGVVGGCISDICADDSSGAVVRDAEQKGGPLVAMDEAVVLKKAASVGSPSPAPKLQPRVLLGEQRYVHRSVAESRLLPKLLPQGAGKRARSDDAACKPLTVTGDDEVNHQPQSTTPAEIAAHQPSRRQALEQKRLDALYGKSGKKKR